MIAPLPSFIIQRGMAGAGILAWIIVQKYVDHLPLYRQIEQFKRFGMPVPSSTMSDWVGMSLKELTPVYEVLKKKVLSSNYLQADETPIKVLDEKKKGESHRGYYWVYRDPQSRLVLFDYRESRSREGPTEILKSFAKLEYDFLSVKLSSTVTDEFLAWLYSIKINWINCFNTIPLNLLLPHKI